MSWFSVIIGIVAAVISVSVGVDAKKKDQWKWFVMVIGWGMHVGLQFV